MADKVSFSDQLKGLNLSDLDWNRVGVWPLPGRLFLLLLALALLVTLVYFAFVKAKNETLMFAEQKEQELRGIFEKKAFEAANLESYRKQMEEMEVSFNALKQQLPKDTEVPGLLEDIDEKGVDSRLDIQSITLLPEVASEFYIELPIEIKVSGGFHEFGAFVSGVAGMPRIVTLHDFSIGKKDKGSNLSMTINAKTYRYKEQE